MNKRQKIDRVYEILHGQNRFIDKLRKEKDEVYRERNKLVSVLSKIYPAWLGKHDIKDTTWHKEWLNIVYMQVPTGQVSWHIHDSELKLFNHLKYEDEAWDGHSTEEKYKRLEEIEYEL